MPSYIIYANADDYSMASEDDGTAWWGGANEGHTSIYPDSTGASILRVGGALFFGTTYTCRQAFLHFDTSAVVGTETSTTLNVNVQTVYGSGDTIEAREKTWSGGGSGNFTAGSSLGSLAAFASAGINFNSTGLKTYTKADPAITKSATYGIILAAERQRTNTAPMGEDWAQIHSADASGTSNDPYLSITTTVATNGTATGSITFTGAATGATPVVGSVAGNINLAGAGAATNPVHGAAAGSMGFAGSATAAFTTTAYSRPSATNSAGGWLTNSGGADLQTALDEQVADDGDFIQGSGVAKIKLETFGDTAFLGDLTLRYRIGKAGPGTINQTVRLVEGTTVIASWVHNNVGALATVEQSINPALITDFGNLFFEVEV